MAQAYFTPISSASECSCMWDHVQLKLVKAANLRLKQYVPPSRTASASIEEIQSNSADFDLVCDSGGFITFTNEFRYLGTIISSDLRDRPDIDRRINQASKAFGSLRSSVFCNEKQLSPIIRRRLFMAIVVNLLLWGCETWALLSEDRNRLNVCFNKWVRAMTGTR